MEVGLHTGVPVMMWRRAVCEGSDCARCEGGAFLDTLRREISGLRGQQLPRRVWELRNEAAGQREGTHCGAHLVLLWDDPGRCPPHDRLIDPQ